MRSIATALAVLAGSVPAAQAAPHRADGKLRDWLGTPTQVAGTSILSRGEHVSSDWLYDDYGADRDGLTSAPSFGGTFSPRRGDLDYPAGKLNAADVRELRLALDRRGLHMAVFLQTLRRRGDAIFTLAIDGGRWATGQWPAGSGIETSFQGPERFVTAWGSGARFDSLSGRRRLRAAANLRANAIEVTVPRRLLGRLARRTRIWLVAGLHDGSGRFRGRDVFDIGTGQFERFTRGGSAWGENAQSSALPPADRLRPAEAAELEHFAATIRPRRMASGASDRRRPMRPGTYQAVFRSRQRYGEGIRPRATPSFGGSARPLALSRYQPYTLHVPRGYDPTRRTPLLIAGHSRGGNHLQYPAFSPNLYRQLGDQRRSLAITPFGRGLDTWYLDAGLVDVLEAWADVRRRLRVDPERTSIAGYSMGGYMTYRLGLLMPDRFARASVHVGPPAFFLWPFPNPIVTKPRWRVAGDTNLIVENGLNLPYEIVHGTRDELVPVAGVQEQADSFARAGNPYRFFRHETDDHLAFAAGDDWSRTREWLGDHRRARSPVEVVYRRFPRMDLPRRGLVFDGAYWVDGIDLRDADEETDSGLVRATTLALAGRRRVARLEPQRIVTGPYSPAALTEQLRVPGEAIQRRNGFEATLRNVAAVTFRFRVMGIDASRRVSASIGTDGPSRVVFAGELPLPRARLDGRRVPLILGRRETVAVDVPSGLHRLELLPP